jgi:hypothetical protein
LWTHASRVNGHIGDFDREDVVTLRIKTDVEPLGRLPAQTRGGGEDLPPVEKPSQREGGSHQPEDLPYVVGNPSESEDHLLTGRVGVEGIQEVQSRRAGVGELETDVISAHLKPLGAPHLRHVGQGALEDEARVDAVDLGRLGAISEEGLHDHSPAVNEFGVRKELPRVPRGS